MLISLQPFDSLRNAQWELELSIAISSESVLSVSVNRIPEQDSSVC